jgi:hypothetical protein
MAYASWLNIVISHGRSGPLYRLYDAVTNLLAGGMAGKWTVVDTSDGASPAWTNDTDPGDGDWIVVQSESAWSGGAKMQVFLGFRASTGALAGFGSKAAGLYCVFSPDGQWDAVNFYFGTGLADWRNGSIKTITGITAACTMGLILTGGDTDLPGSFVLLERSGTGNNSGFAVVALEPPTNLAKAKSRSVIVAGTAINSNNVGYWGVTAANTGLSPDVGLTSWGGTNIAGADFGRDRESGQYTETPCWSYNTVDSRYIGITPEVIRATSAANGDVSTDGLRWAWGLYSFPREASRDGFWV